MSLEILRLPTVLIKAMGVNKVAEGERENPGGFYDLNQIHSEGKMLHMVRGL